MSFEIRDKDLAGRIGVLETKHGKVETPIFLPVINPVRQERDLPLSEIANMGFNAIITNAYILYRNYGREVSKVGVHKFLGFNGVVMTDSGAYQLMRYGSIDVSPEDIVKYQIEIGSDIGVILDIPTTYEVSYDEAKFSVEETLRRAMEVLRYVKDSEVLWVLPVQGGIHIDLVEYSAKEASKFSEYSMYAVGSPVTLLEQYRFEKIVEMVFVAKKYLPLDKPLHLFGAGHPLIIPFAVALGVDTFDSASYVLYARDERVMTYSGTVKLSELSYLPCNCPVCSKYGVEELKELSKDERVKLIAKHNLYMLQLEIRRVKQAIKEGRLWEYLEERSRSHPSARRAFNELLKYVEFLEKLDPRTRGNIRALFLYDSTSLRRPELTRLKSYVVTGFKLYKEGSDVVLIPANPLLKPFNKAETFMKLLEKRPSLESGNVFFIIPFLGLVPIELAETYPSSQFEMPLNVSKEVIDDLLNTIKAFLEKRRHIITKVIVIADESVNWFNDIIINKLVSTARELGIGIKVEKLN
ncbi:MAG: tRNA guanosine(15) transglycosylase TgtA [Desulfurococcales archaeon ex4484_42]|nr:MAG: tRNA guanosine(15) transglycosylase TgtA [Desulfurococcales archaeon ex4484_42]